MSRWEPDASGRLQRAAMALFLERGYAGVTVADITDRAGLTKRSFFNHFTDKREVLFAGSAAFQRAATDPLVELDPAMDPLEAATTALTQAGLSLADYSEFGGARRELIASSTELQERELVKLASLTQALQDGLIARGATPRTARFTAEAAITVFNAAYDDWIDQPDSDFAELMSRCLDELQTAIERPERREPRVPPSRRRHAGGRFFPYALA